MIDAVKSVMQYLGERQVYDVLVDHVKSVEEKVGELKSELTITDGTVQDLGSVEEQINEILLNGEIELNHGDMISFGELKEHLMGITSNKIDEAIDTVKKEVGWGWAWYGVAKPQRLSNHPIR